MEQTTQVRIYLASSVRALLGALPRSANELERELRVRVARVARPSSSRSPGCGALTAAKLLAEIAAVGRFATDAQLARFAGVAPLEACSGKHASHRLDRGGNRQLNAALYRIAITQARVHAPAR